MSDQTYFEELKKFKRIQQQKNSLLRSGDISKLETWNWLLANNIQKISEIRGKYIDEINTLIKKITFSGQLGFRLGYFPSINTENKSAEQILAFLMEVKNRELKTGFMLYGSHRDNIDFFLDGGMPGKDVFSQGEYRAAFLTLLFSANRYLQNKKSERPIILLDDIFSELDKDNTERLIELLHNLSNQIFITGVHKKEILKAKFFNVDNNNFELK